MSDVLGNTSSPSSFSYQDAHRMTPPLQALDGSNNPAISAAATGVDGLGFGDLLFGLDFSGDPAYYTQAALATPASTSSQAQSRSRAARQHCSVEGCAAYTALKCARALCPTHCARAGHGGCTYHAARSLPRVPSHSGSPAASARNCAVSPSRINTPELPQATPPPTDTRSPLPSLPQNRTQQSRDTPHSWARVLQPALPSAAVASSPPPARSGPPTFSTQMNPLWMQQRNGDIARRQVEQDAERARKEKAARARQYFDLMFWHAVRLSS